MSEGQSGTTNPFRKKPSSDDLPGLVVEFEKSQREYAEQMEKVMVCQAEWDKHTIENNPYEAEKFKRIILNLMEESLKLRTHMLQDLHRLSQADKRRRR